MPTFSLERLRVLLEPYEPDPSPLLLEQLSTYLDLLIRWNARTNLSAIRVPEEMVRRHFGESLFGARFLQASGTLLDVGSGAGFPGLPMALARPGLSVVLAESQNKKASFLREVIRTLGVQAEVWPLRVEAMPPERRFDVVTLRAVDQPARALELAKQRVVEGGMILHFTHGLAAEVDVVSMPARDGSVLQILRR